jgi:uncharacterized protein YndB with AHSA1/START domain
MMEEGATKTAGTRAIEQQIEMAASPEAVWKALTEAEGLKRWFPLDARVEPGVGGSVWLSWGPGVEGAARIEIWEPNSHLRTAENWGGQQAAVDYYIEARGGGRTIFRVVHSGFSIDSTWDEQYDGTEGGWIYFLRSLKLYLERHEGTPRTLIWERRVSPVPRPEVWNRVTGSVRPAIVPGTSVTFDMGGVSHRAVVEVARAPGQLALLLPDVQDSLLFIELESSNEGWHCGVWLSTYGLDESRVSQLRAQVSAFADRILAS